MRRSVLIIDDSPGDAGLCEMTLARVPGADYAVRHTSNGESGLASIASEGADCVLLDYSLPGRNGLEILKLIKNVDPFLPVIMLTGRGDETLAVQAMKAGAQSYLPKSTIRPDILHAAITTAIAECRERKVASKLVPPMWTVLIIDDSEDDREAVIRALKHAHGPGYRYLEAGDGMHGITLIGEHHPDCTLLDYSLPGRNGLEILKLIHIVDPFLPVIMLTGKGDEAVAVKAMKAGAQNYLVKSSVAPDMLHRAVEFAIHHATLERQIGEQRQKILAQQQELTQTNRLNTAILDSSTYMIVATDIDGLILVCNRAAEMALGHAAAEVVGKCTPMLWFDRDEVERRATELSEELGTHVEPDFDVLVRMSRGESSRTNEWIFVRKDGSRFPAHVSITPLRDHENRAVGFLTMIEDITERLQKDAALRDSEETFRSAIEHAPNGMALADPDGRWLKVNQALCQLLGMKQEELMQTNFRILAGLDEAEADRKGLQALVTGEVEVFRQEKQFLHTTGRTVWTLLNLSLARDAGGAPKHFIVQLQDITNQKEMDRMKSEFISVVSHELRTPLTSIRGSLGLVIGTMGRDLPDKAVRLIDIAHKNCERLIVLINDILDIDKIASGQMRFVICRENLAALLQQAVDANRGFAERLEVSIALAPIPDDWTVDTDAARLIQILSNLLSNATKFSPAGATVELFAERRDGTVRIHVRDHGPGISEEFSRRIFSRFSQADSSIARKQSGSGLGLHISKELIEHMGGHIGFTSEVGKGTTFWVDVTAGRSSEPAAPEATAHGHPSGGRVLVCEDDDDVGELIRTILTNAGLAADVVHTIPEARRRIMTGQYDAMTLDVTFPQGDGIEFARELGGDRLASRLPIVVISCNPKAGRIADGSTTGVVDWIVKPFDHKDLVRVVEGAINARSRLEAVSGV
jgi:PAS domain S-box-containing protein